MESRELIGTVVNKGDLAEAIIIDAKEDFLGKGFIVLCLIPERKEFVTWLMTEDAGTVNGHYFLNLSMAFDEFKAR